MTDLVVETEGSRTLNMIIIMSLFTTPSDLTCTGCNSVTVQLQQVITVVIGLDNYFLSQDCIFRVLEKWTRPCKPYDK